MQFTKENAEKIMCGDKTQTRRICESEDSINPGVLSNGSKVALRASAMVPATAVKIVQRDWRIKWVVGQEYAVQPGRGKPAIGRIKITAISREKVQQITAKDSWAEGIRLLKSDYGHSRAHDEVVFPYGRFEQDYKWAFRDLWQSLYAYQPGKRWGDNPEVWVLTFELVKEGGSNAKH